MKIILLRDKGRHFALQLSRKMLAALAAISCGVLATGILLLAMQFKVDTVDAEVVAQWRAKLAAQRDEVLALEKKSQAQSVAVGRRLAGQALDHALLVLEPRRAEVSDQELHRGAFVAGVHQVRWEAVGLASGVYVYLIEAGTYRQTRSMLLLR